MRVPLVGSTNDKLLHSYHRRLGGGRHQPRPRLVGSNGAAAPRHRRLFLAANHAAILRPERTLDGWGGELLAHFDLAVFLKTPFDHFGGAQAGLGGEHVEQSGLPTFLRW
ncbi:hypothetical protein [Bradyrhizobium sp.]|uniref:hypothetical protein n=1 Tax=Bradyrhizobium sp. TaxID=376 RepID=UPI003C703A4D